MARTYWDVYYDIGAGWVADGTLPRPNDTLTYNYSSTQTTVQLADGSKAYISPETKSNKETITFVWYWDDGTYKTKIENYINNNTYLRIVTHVPVHLVGRFTSLRASHVVGLDDSYDLEATFEWVI